MEHRGNARPGVGPDMGSTPPHAENDIEFGNVPWRTPELPAHAGPFGRGEELKQIDKPRLASFPPGSSSGSAARRASTARTAGSRPPERDLSSHRCDSHKCEGELNGDSIRPRARLEAKPPDPVLD